MKFWSGICIGAFVSWFITADHYGHIVREDKAAGILCRVHGLDSVRRGDWGETYHVCVDLTYATPESDLWADFWQNFYSAWSYPQ